MVALLSSQEDFPHELEPELHEGDGRIPGWLWIAVAIVILYAGVLAPFELFWPVA